MADSPSQHSFNKTHFQDPNSSSNSIPTKPTKSKLFHFFFSKSLILILVLLIFSFFPSQVPQYFKKSTIINTIWDLIYLLVIGIVICYGLFSRKIDRVYSSCSSDDNNIGSQESYLSGISHISSIFENGIQNSYGFDEKDVFERSEFGNCDKKKKVNLNQCFLGESLVVINDENYVLEQLGKPKSIRVSKSSDFFDSNQKSCVEDCSINGNENYGMKNMKFGGLVPIKLEEKFKESDSNSNSDTQTPLNWRSKSIRVSKTSDFFYSNQKSCVEDCSINGNENYEMENMKFGGWVPIKLEEKSKESDSNSNSNSDTKTNWRSKSMRLENQEDICCHESVKSKSLRFSEPIETKNCLQKEPKGIDISSSKTNTQSSFKETSEETAKGFGRIQRSSIRATNLETLEPMLGKSDSSNLSLKPAVLSYKRGKSVRTNRPKEKAVEEAKVKTDEKVETGSKNDDLSDAESHSSEVDRKADEFIAKFREQIRLQQAASSSKRMYKPLVR